MATKPIKTRKQDGDTELPLVVICGPTASGKSELALGLALKFNGEIICSDSRTIYKGLDIATAKPTYAEQQLVQHWGLDLVEPNERYTAADFKEYVDKKIKEIKNRAHLPIMVGGTGLYIDAVYFNYQFGGVANAKLRSELQHLTIKELHEYAAAHDIMLPENDKNKRYIIRKIENGRSVTKKNVTPAYKNIIVGITTDKHKLQTRMEERIEHMLENGVIEEAIQLSEKYGWTIESMKSNMYPLIRRYLLKEITIEELRTQSLVSDWRLAKRQMTWLKRNRFIHWDDLDGARRYLFDQLARNE